MSKPEHELTMTAYVVEWSVIHHQGNDYLMPWEYGGRMAFGSRDVAETVRNNIAEQGYPDAHGYSNKCEQVTVTEMQVPHRVVLHKIPDFLLKQRTAI